MSTKPHIRADPFHKLPDGVHFWECSRDPLTASLRVCGYGYDPRAAFRSWENRSVASRLVAERKGAAA